jgi:hypothetical protein
VFLGAAQHVQVVVADLAHLDDVLRLEDDRRLGDHLPVAVGEHGIDRDAVGPEHIEQALARRRVQGLRTTSLVAEHDRAHALSFMSGR